MSKSVLNDYHYKFARAIRVASFRTFAAAYTGSDTEFLGLRSGVSGLFLAISGKIVMYKVVGMCLFRNQLATCTMRTSALRFFRNDCTSTASYSACGTVGCNGLLSGSLVDYRPV